MAQNPFVISLIHAKQSSSCFPHVLKIYQIPYTSKILKMAILWSEHQEKYWPLVKAYTYVVIFLEAYYACNFVDKI